MTAAAIDRYLLPAPDPSSKPAGCYCLSMGQTDRRTDTRPFYDAYCVPCGPRNVQFTPPARHDKTVLSVSCRAVWPKSEQLADRSPSLRGVLRRSLGLVICSSPQRVYILRGVQRRWVWAVGRLGVAACLACVAAAAVDRQARQSCRVQCAGMNLAIALNVFRLQMFCRR